MTRDNSTRDNNTASSRATTANSTESPIDHNHEAQAPQATGFLGWIERLGNKLPNPFWLFVILSGVVLVSSWLAHLAGLNVEDPSNGEAIEIKNLLSSEGLHDIINNAVENFTSFPPLGTIVTVMLGVAVAEYSGLISAAIRAGVSKVGPRALTFAIALAGVTGSIASDAVYAILIPLGAMAFHAVGRSPIVGAMVAFAASSGGFNSSLILNITDILLAGISTTGAQIVDADYEVSPLANYFFVTASAIVLALIITAVTELFMVKKVRELVDHNQLDESELAFESHAADATDTTGSSEDSLELTPLESRGLKITGLVTLVLLAAYFALMFIPGSPLQGEGGAVMESPLITGIVVPISVMFFILGAVYGVIIKSITSWNDIPDFMAHGLKTMLPILVLFFAISQFLEWFNESNLGRWTAIKGSDLLATLNLPPLVLFFLFVLLVFALNLLITSGSAQWALMAPIVVPMFMYLGYSPEVTQMLFRIGDSPSNIITPMSPYFALALMFLQRYYKRAGVGTLMSLALPYAVAMVLGWFAFFAVWWLIGLPLGPGSPMDYPVQS